MSHPPLHDGTASLSRTIMTVMTTTRTVKEQPEPEPQLQLQLQPPQQLQPQLDKLKKEKKKKKPLLLLSSSTTNRHRIAAAPPLTATTKRLAAILDGKSKALVHNNRHCQNPPKRRKLNPPVHVSCHDGVTQANVTPTASSVPRLTGDPPHHHNSNNDNNNHHKYGIMLNLSQPRTLQQARGWKPAVKAVVASSSSLSTRKHKVKGNSQRKTKDLVGAQKPLVPPPFTSTASTLRETTSQVMDTDILPFATATTGPTALSVVPTPRDNLGPSRISPPLEPKQTQPAPQPPKRKIALPSRFHASHDRRERWQAMVGPTAPLALPRPVSCEATVHAHENAAMLPMHPEEEPISHAPHNHAPHNHDATTTAAPGTIDYPTVRNNNNNKNFIRNEPLSLAAAVAAATATDAVLPMTTTTTTTKGTVNLPTPSSVPNHQSKARSTTAAYRPNLVRLNLRNSNGSCRNKRGKPKRHQHRPSYHSQSSNKPWGGDAETTRMTAAMERPVGLCLQTGTDLVDDFVDGAVGNDPKTATGIPLCQGHQQPCRIRTVRKSGPNKGKQFYACSLERAAQCNHFQWADPSYTVEGGTRQTKTTKASQEDTTTAFVQRQVQAYLQNLQPLTLPELRTWAKARQLATSGQRGHVWTRIALHVRDEIASALAVSDDAVMDETGAVAHTNNTSDKDAHVDDNDDYNNGNHYEDDDDDESDDDGELELTGARPYLRSALSSQQGKEQNSANIASKESLVYQEEELTEDEVSDKECIDDDDELEIMERKTSSKRSSTTNGRTLDCPLRERLLSLFGHADFRPGQEWTIRRCLEGQRTLLVAPTGLGKSLCYALPAALQPEGVVLVVSPLLSLIQDQLRELPPSLPAASLSGTTPSPTLLQDLRRGRLRILFVSPERLVSPSFRRLFSKTSWNEATNSYERIMPPVTLFCVDEAHCLSQWGHNFRPCYLRLRSMLSLIQPKSVLAITATAGPRVIEDITCTLGMPKLERSATGEIQNSCIKIYKADRDNIDVTAHFVANHADRLNRLVAILSPPQKGGAFNSQAGCLARGSVIVYVWRQMDAEAVAEYIASANVPGKVVVYHGGMDSNARAKSQSQFLRGKARICVATVAFGLGINKSDVAGVLHMYLSASPEHYLQEIGRAGRDGSQSQAIALILPEEVQVRHSLSHSDLLAKSQVSTLFKMLRDEVHDSLSKLPEDRQNTVESLSVGLSLQSTLVGCECKPETVETIFSLLEAREMSLLRVQGSFYGRAIVAPRKQSLEILAQREHVVAAILRCCQCVEPPAGQERDEKRMVGFTGHNLIGQTYGSFCFSIAQCSNCLGPDAEPRHVFAALRRLQADGQIDYVLDTTTAGRYIHVRLNKTILDLLSIDKVKSSYNELIEETCHGFNLAVNTSAEKVIEIYRTLRQISKVPLDDMHSETKSASLYLFQKLIQDYFAKEGDATGNTPETERAVENPFATRPAKKALDLTVWSVVQHLTQLQLSRASCDATPMSLDPLSNPDFTALAVTKFLHGIAPASASPSLCRQHNSFGSLQSVEFNALREVVASVVG